MKKTGRRVYLSGIVRSDTAEFVYDVGGTPTAALQNILVDERRGYAYKVTFVSTYPNTTNDDRNFGSAFGLYSLSRRELLRMTQVQGAALLGFTRDLAALNRNIAVVGRSDGRGGADTDLTPNYQSSYVVKGDAMVTQSLSIGWNLVNRNNNSSNATYYIELDEYEVSSDEEILLILQERAQDASGIIE